MYGSEDIRFRAGDACCSILDQVYDVGPVGTRARHWLQGRSPQRVWDGPRIGVSLSWRWSCCHESELGIARSLTDVPMRHA